LDIAPELLFYDEKTKTMKIKKYETTMDDLYEDLFNNNSGKNIDWNKTDDSDYLLFVHYMEVALQKINKLHQHDILHNDLKLNNIVVDLKNGEVRLIDYGLSHCFQHDHYDEYNIFMPRYTEDYCECNPLIDYSLLLYNCHRHYENQSLFNYLWKSIKYMNGLSEKQMTDSYNRIKEIVKNE